MKIDAKDAVHLARLLRLDEITTVVLPTVELEAALTISSGPVRMLAVT